MFARPPKTFSAFRSASIALLLLGLVLNPLLAYMGDMHHLEHATVSFETDDTHHHQIDDAISDNGSEDGQSEDVWHGLMHAGHTHAAWEARFFVSMPALVHRTHSAVFPPAASLSPRQHLVGPFRPPIA